MKNPNNSIKKIPGVQVKNSSYNLENNLKQFRNTPEMHLELNQTNIRDGDFFEKTVIN